MIYGNYKNYRNYKNYSDYNCYSFYTSQPRFWLRPRRSHSANKKRKQDLFVPNKYTPKKAPNIQINLMLGVSLLCTLRYAQSLVSFFVCSRLTAFFSNTSSFTCKVTEVIQFSTTYFTNFVNLDFVDKWRVHREDTFNTYVV